MPSSRAVASSTLRAGIAVEYTTASASRGTFSARLPTATCTPAASNRASATDSLRSEPLTVWPMRASSKAIALIPTPPIPTI